MQTLLTSTNIEKLQNTSFEDPIPEMFDTEAEESKGESGPKAAAMPLVSGESGPKVAAMPLVCAPPD